MSIKRCPLTRLPDVSWQVADWQQSVVHPTYDITGGGRDIAARSLHNMLRVYTNSVSSSCMGIAAGG
jgi:hypothetical protein